MLVISLKSVWVKDFGLTLGEYQNETTLFLADKVSFVWNSPRLSRFTCSLESENDECDSKNIIYVFVWLIHT